MEVFPPSPNWRNGISSDIIPAWGPGEARWILKNYEIVLVLKPYVCIVLVNEEELWQLPSRSTQGNTESETQGFKPEISGVFLSHASDPKLF